MNTIRNPIFPSIPNTKDPKDIERWMNAVTELLMKTQEDLYVDLENHEGRIEALE